MFRIDSSECLEVWRNDYFPMKKVLLINKYCNTCSMSASGTFNVKDHEKLYVTYRPVPAQAGPERDPK
jgi:hypothetical protein